MMHLTKKKNINKCVMLDTSCSDCSCLKYPYKSQIDGRVQVHSECIVHNLGQNMCLAMCIWIQKKKVNLESPA